MPVWELVRGLAGALGALLATVLLVLCLAETAMRYGQPQYGIWWLPGKSWNPYFSPIWHPVLFHGMINLIVGYLLAGKLTSKRNALYALASAVLLPVVMEVLLQSPLPDLYGKAGRNTCWLLDLFFALAGAYAGAAIAEKSAPAKRRRKKKSDVLYHSS